MRYKKEVIKDKYDKNKYDKDEWLKEKTKNYENNLSAMKCFKVSLKRIVRDQSTIKTIEDAVFRTNKIVIHTYQFLKMFYIHQFLNNQPVPIINKNIVREIMFTIAKSSRKNQKDDQTVIHWFYNNYYKQTMSDNDDLSYANLIQVLDYEAVSIVTGIKNHIQEKFEHMLNKYINILVDKKKLSDHGKKEDISELIKLKKDLFKNTNKSSPKYDHIKQYFKDNILKDFKSNQSLQNIANGKNKLDLLVLLIRMSIDGERISRDKLEDVDKNNNNFGIINAFPLRTSIRPRYITIDTVMAVNMTCKGNKRKYYSTISSNYDNIWKIGFKTENRSFKKRGYRFNNMIKTDGFGCSIFFIRNDLYGQKIDHESKPFGYKDELYVDDLTDIQKKELIDKKFVAFDPGVDNIIFGTNGQVETITKKNGKKYRKAKIFSYNRSMREHECLVKCYRKKIDDIKHKTIIGTKNVIQIETELSRYNSSTCNWSSLNLYVKAKNKVNSLLFDFYKNEIHRRLHWYSYINRQRSESKMLNRLEDAFGKPDNTVVLIGDWSRNTTPKNQVPVKGKSIRKLIKSKGYKLFLVNEFRTSCREYQTGEKLDNFRWDKEKSQYVHRLLASKRLRKERAMTAEDLKVSRQNKDGLPTIINRDLNASLNILLKGTCIIKGEKIPEYFNRPKKNECKELSELILPIPVILDGFQSKKVIKTPKHPGKVIKTPKNPGIIYTPNLNVASRPGTKKKEVTGIVRVRKATKTACVYRTVEQPQLEVFQKKMK